MDRRIQAARRDDQSRLWARPEQTETAIRRVLDCRFVFFLWHEDPESTPVQLLTDQPHQLLTRRDVAVVPSQQKLHTFTSFSGSRIIAYSDSGEASFHNLMSDGRKPLTPAQVSTILVHVTDQTTRNKNWVAILGD